MMTAAVVYASRSGNTRAVAEAIAEGLRSGGEATVVAAEDVAALPAGLDLLVVGGPTEGHGITPEVRHLLDRIAGSALEGLAVAAFDTRFHLPRWMSGSAASRIAETLGVSGARPAVAPESFFVHGAEPVLIGGEAERAAAWGRALAATVSASDPAAPR